MNLLLIGPTAVGKTALSIRLAEQLGAAVVSADSRQCYKGMDIGTAKPTPSEMEKVPHFNVSILEPHEPDSAAAFVGRVSRWQSEHEYPHWIFVGGSTLYLQSLMFPLDDIPKTDPSVLRQLEAAADQNGLESLYKELQSVDPEYALKMDGLNRQRIIRALAVWKQTGRRFSSYHQREGFGKPENALVFGLTMDRAKLVERMDARVDAMIRDGLVEEVKGLLKEGFSPEHNAMRTVGYQEVVDMLHHGTDAAATVEAIKAHTRQYSRRQMTWFRRWPFVEWLHMDVLSVSEAADHIVSKVQDLEILPK